MPANNPLSKIQALIQEKTQLKFSGPQFWKPPGLISRIAPAAQTQSWLKTPTSLTARLRKHCPELEVVILSEQFETPLINEAQKLGLVYNEEAWVRCVLLKCRQRSWIYARTVIPRMDAQNPWQELQTLGAKPLGEILFDKPSVNRSAFEFSKDSLAHWPHLMKHLNAPELAHKPGFARRSVFKQKGAPLLLTEVFLPGLLDQSS